jgi:hypothetical protein
MIRRLSWLVSMVVACGIAGCGGGGGKKKCEVASQCEAGELCSAIGECLDPASARLSATATAEGAIAEIAIFRADGTMCEPSGCDDLPFGTRVSFRAPTLMGFGFAGWSGSSPQCAGGETELVIAALQADARCVARYVRQVRVSAVDPTGQGEVAARAQPPARCVGASCEVAVGTEVVLSASDRPNARFGGWSGPGCTGSGNTLTVRAGEVDTVCTARFIERFSVVGTLAGSDAQVMVSAMGEGARCEPTRCTVDRGASATLSAPQRAGQRFAGWSGTAACTGAEPTLQVANVTANEACNANYVERRRVSASSAGAMPAAVITVDSPDGFKVCAPGSCEIDVGGMVTLAAPSVAGYRLSHWSGSRCDGQVATALELRDVVEDVACVANYVQGIAVSGGVLGAPGEVTASSESQFAMCAKGSCTLDVGGAVKLTAPTLEGYRFLGWEGDADCKGSETSLTFSNVTVSKTCYARYATRFTVRGAASEGGGSVKASSTSAAASCNGGTCAVDAGGEVTLEAAPAAGQRFTGWSGGGPCTGQGATIRVTDVRTNVSCTANFVPRLVVTGVVAPMGAGSVAAVSSAPAMCMGAICTVDSGARVELRATAAEGYRFVRWSECGTGTEATIAVESVTANTTCRANFERITYDLTVRRNVAGGEVAITAPAPSCVGPMCTKNVVVGSTVSIEARPAANYAFQSWSGCMGASNTRTAMVVVNGPTTCTANFIRTYQASVSALLDTTQSYQPMPANSYAVTVTTEAGSCTGNMCTVQAEANAIFTASAANGSGYRFDRWECSGQTHSSSSSSFTLSITGDISCIALFRPPVSYYVSGQVFLSGAPAPQAGTIVASADSPWASCSGSACTVLPGTEVRLSATGIGNVVFQGWVCGAQSYTAAMIPVVPTSGDVACTANFVPR